MVPDSIVARVRSGHHNGEHFPLCSAERRVSEHQCSVEMEVSAQSGGIETVNRENAWKGAGGVTHALVLIEKVSRSVLGPYHFDPSHSDLFCLWGAASRAQKKPRSRRRSTSACFEYDCSREKCTRVA